MHLHCLGRKIRLESQAALASTRRPSTRPTLGTRFRWKHTQTPGIRIMSAPLPRLPSESVAFVTVGTTSFDALVLAVDCAEVEDALLSKGIDIIRLQIGRGCSVPSYLDARCIDDDAVAPVRAAAPLSAATASTAAAAAAPEEVRRSSVPRRRRLRCEYFRFRSSLESEFRGAALVISHAGAGSIFEALRAARPLIVVVNEALMDNHQVGRRTPKPHQLIILSVALLFFVALPVSLTRRLS